MMLWIRKQPQHALSIMQLPVRPVLRIASRTDRHEGKLGNTVPATTPPSQLHVLDANVHVNRMKRHNKGMWQI